MKAYLLILFSMFLNVGHLNAFSLVEATSVKIKKVSVYSEIGSGDVLITVTNPPFECERGLWVSGDAAGVDRVLSFLLTAKATNATVSINGDKDNIWPGTSAGKVCHIYNVDII